MQSNDIETCLVVPPGFCNRGEVRYGSIGGLEYEVPQSRLYCLCINVALCSTALQCICRVIRRRSMTMKAHTYYIIFGRPPIGGKLPLHCDEYQPQQLDTAADVGIHRIFPLAYRQFSALLCRFGPVINWHRIFVCERVGAHHIITAIPTLLYTK